MTTTVKQIEELADKASQALSDLLDALTEHKDKRWASDAIIDLTHAIAHFEDVEIEIIENAI